MKSKSALIGYVLVGVFCYLALTKATSNPQMFFNMHGLGIVIGGLVVAALASFPWTVLSGSIRSIYKKVSSGGTIDHETGNALVRLTSAYQKNISEFEKEAELLPPSFLKEATNLVLEGLPKETIGEILEKRIEEKRADTSSHVNVMLTLSKYSPALGLAATVLGLVDLLSKLSSADMGKLGHGMAIALSATFYGIIFSNLVFAPLSEIISSNGEFEVKELEMIKDCLAGMLEKENAIVIGEVVNSYLPTADRINFVDKLQTQNKPGNGRMAS